MKGVFMVNQQHCFGIDGSKSEDATKALIEGRRQIKELVAFYRKYVPGCEDCFLLDTANTLGVRETRRVLGDYLLSGDEILSGAKFDDAVLRYSYFMDLHFKEENGQTRELKPGDCYEIPYRCLLPKGIDWLLTAGRCVSGSHEALSSYRLMSPCMALGQAAGTAAALALKTKKPPREIEAKILRQTLLKDGALL
jgi:succinate dehydrogenase/fumarate reductase flavoprotein subunit